MRLCVCVEIGTRTRSSVNRESNTPSHDSILSHSQPFYNNITCYYNVASHFVTHVCSIILQYLVIPGEVHSNPSNCQIRFEQMNANCNGLITMNERIVLGGKREQQFSKPSNNDKWFYSFGRC